MDRKEEMELGDRSVSEEHREQRRCAGESADHLAVSPLEMVRCYSLPKPPSRNRSGGRGRSAAGALRRSLSSRDGRPKKGGAGGKGTWGGLLDREERDHRLHPNDPNYDSDENDPTSPDTSEKFLEFKRKATVIIEEYFTTDDAALAASELLELDYPSRHYYFVKKLISTAMDRHDKEKEMAALLVSNLYSQVISPQQVYKGFRKLVECCDDLCVDIPHAVDDLALFIARAVVDDILPPAFLSMQVDYLPKESKGIDVMKRAWKSYLSAPLHAEIILQRWVGSKSVRVEDVRARISSLLKEYVVSGDKVEACRCIRDLKLPFFHHEIVKRALVVAMEKPPHRDRILDLLKAAIGIGTINSSQLSLGFNRLISTVDDLSLDIPGARAQLRSLISDAASEGWLCVSSLEPFPAGKTAAGGASAAGDARRFKAQATTMIGEYFLTADVMEVLDNLATATAAASAADVSSLNAMFVKKLVTMAMDRKNREREMASVLLSSLPFPSEDTAAGFAMLLDSVEDTALDIPAAADVLRLFLARAVVDEAVAPRQLEEMWLRCEGCNPMGSRVVQEAKSMLRAKLGGERLLRCWGGGGGGSSRSGWELDDVKAKMKRILEEYECGGEAGEACRCIKELGMPFFHHELVKKALIGVMEKKEERLWGLLRVCYEVGLISEAQMTKGFRRVGDCLADLVLDVPDVVCQYRGYVERAKRDGWIDTTFDCTGGAAGGGGDGTSTKPDVV